MDLSKNGQLLRLLRKEKELTQRQLAEKLEVEPKTVSKWETGRGFPDVSTVSALADALGVSERILLSSRPVRHTKEVGNMQKFKFYICPHCGSFMQGTGENRVVCCGQPVGAATAKKADENHSLSVSETENDFYIEFSHEMTKEHFIGFVSYVSFDRVLTVRLYPEQDASVRFPKTYGGKLYYYCNRHGLFVHS